LGINVNGLGINVIALEFNVNGLGINVIALEFIYYALEFIIINACP